MFFTHSGRGCGPRGVHAMRGHRGWDHKGGRQGWADWGDHGGHGGGRGRRPRMFDSGELRLVLLRLIGDQARHGYDLIREIEERTGGAYAPSPGVVYPTLTLLEDMGLIEEQQSEGSKKLFAITAAGEAHLGEQVAEAEALLARLERIGAERARTDSRSIRRAMGNLRQALVDRLGDGAGDETLDEVVAILDEAAQKIERLK